MKILFAQLPLTDHSHSYVLGNIEYGPASISAYLKLRVDNTLDVTGLPRLISSYGSNSTIISYISGQNPDIVSFTNYLWNVERNLNIAAELKKINHKTKIIMGGPEINTNSWALNEKREAADFFVSGEGEWFFKRHLEGEGMGKYSRDLNGNILVTQPENELLETADIVEPCTSKFLNPMDDGSIFLELTRGCPYRCVYCFYSKHCLKVRELPFETLLYALSGKTGLSIKEIYILSPSFNTTPDFRNRLMSLADAGHGIRLHTEMRAQGIDDELAGLIYQAGFRSLEVGIQTLTRRALDEIGRKGDPEDELAGMIALKNAGLDLKIGIIPGLPGDTPGMFKNSIDRLMDLGFGDNIELYPLMVLPGTEIRERGERDGIKFQQKPPYFILDGWNFNFQSLREITQYAENETGFTHVYRRLPDFSMRQDGGLTGGIKFNGDSIPRREGSMLAGHVETNPFSCFIDITSAAVIEEVLSKLFSGKKIEDQFFNIIFFCNEIADEKDILEFLFEYDGDHFYRRLNIFADWAAGSRIKLYQVFDEPATCLKAEEICRLVEPVIRVTEKNFQSLADMSRAHPANILVGRGMFSRMREYMIDNYSLDHENAAFEDELEHEEFYRAIGQEYIKLTVPFKCVMLQG